MRHLRRRRSEAVLRVPGLRVAQEASLRAADVGRHRELREGVVQDALELDRDEGGAGKRHRERRLRRLVAADVGHVDGSFRSGNSCFAKFNSCPVLQALMFFEIFVTEALQPWSSKSLV